MTKYTYGLEVNEIEDQLTNYQLTFHNNIFGNNETIIQTWSEYWKDGNYTGTYTVITLVIDHDNDNSQKVYIGKNIDKSSSKHTVAKGRPINELNHKRIN